MSICQACWVIRMPHGSRHDGNKVLRATPYVRMLRREADDATRAVQNILPLYICIYIYMYYRNTRKKLTIFFNVFVI